MNFLGHLYFSGNDLELMYANLFGDSVKGRQFDFYPDIIQRGIVLHRRIDTFIDNHPSVMDLKRVLFEELPKVSSVAIDLFFDHLLARNWQDYSTIPYFDFLELFYNYSPNYWESYPESFKTFVRLLRENKWLNYYPLNEGLLKSCEGVSSRISFPNMLYKAPNSFVKYEELITQSFQSYMVDAKLYLADFV